MPLSPEQFQRIEELFHLLEDLDPESRAKRLSELADSEPAIEEELRMLLGDGDGTGDDATEVQGLSALAAEAERLHGQTHSNTHIAAPPTHVRQADNNPRRVGRYRIVRLLGEGGMGQVFEAEQEEPVRRTVAIKLIHTNVATPAATARFEAEQQALAVMDHPNIARVLDADVTEEGRPYFVMELVPGLPINRYCDRHQLNLNQRIDLFLDVLSAVQHAHQKGIIHRDLKPSNILVVPPSEAPEETGSPREKSSDHRSTHKAWNRRAIVKVIDFGIAKAVEEPFLGASKATQIGDLVGTPEYMSPEQASLGAIDIDVRSDVYSLGLVLYELLTGSLPVSGRDLRAAGFDEMRRLIREQEAQRPSDRVATTSSGNTSKNEVEDRGLDRNTLGRSLKGDLDWVILRALEKERERRYDSVGALAEDLRRHLNDEPVSAGPPTFRYRASKFVRRNRITVVAAAAVMLGLLGGLAGISYGLVKARASARESDAARETAQEERQTAERTADFLGGLFRAADPRKRAGKEITVDELLERGIDSVDDLDEEPRTQLRLLGLFGDVYQAQGKLALADPLLQRVIEFSPPADSLPRKQLEREKSLARTRLAGIRRDQARLEEAEELLRKAISEAEPWLDPSSEVLGTANNSLGTVLRQQDRYPEARDAYNKALSIIEAAPEPDAGAAATLLNNLSSLASFEEDYSSAAELNQRAIDQFKEILPAGHPVFGTLYSNRSVMERHLSDLPASLAFGEKSLAVIRKAFRADHLHLVDGMLNLGWTQIDLGRHTAGRTTIREALAMAERMLGPDTPKVAQLHARLGRSYFDQGSMKKAEREYRTTISILTPRATNHREGFATFQQQLATTLRMEGRHKESADATAASLAGPPGNSRTNDETRALLQAAHQQQATDKRAALETFKEAVERAHCKPDQYCSLDDSEGLETRATFLALAGKREQALRALGFYFDHYNRRFAAMDSPDFANLENDAEFQKLRERWKQTVSEGPGGGPTRGGSN